jgi:hypothetical protein
MAGGNMIDADVPWGKAPGTESEQTETAVQGIFHDKEATPDLEYTPDAADSCTESAERTASKTSMNYAPAASAWKMVK